MNKIIKGLLILSATIGLSFTNPIDEFSKFIGKYGDEDFYIVLKEDRTFEYFDSENKRGDIIKGTWCLKNDYVTLIPEKRKRSLKKEWRLLPKECGLVYKSFWITMTIGKHK